MYIRTTSRKNKDGTSVRYIQLAHNERNPKTGQSQAKILYNFGRDDEVNMAALRGLAQSIGRYLGDDPQTADRDPSPIAPLRLTRSKSLGGAWLLNELWQKLGIGNAMTKRLTERQFQTPMERILFALVANRALAPSSKLAAEEWVEHDVVIPELPKLDVQQAYRAMDVLLESEESIQHDVFHAVADLLQLEVDLLFFDTTSTYFETEDEDDEFRKLGYSKDHRPDLPQVVIGFAVTREGIPIRCWVWPGNTSDMSVVPEVKKDLIGWKLGRVISVVDRGFSSEENLRYLQRSGGHYISGEKLSSGKPTVEAALAHPGRFKTVRDNLEVKDITIGDGEARKRYVLVRNPDEARRDAARREKHLTALKEELARLKELDGEAHTKAHCRLHNHTTYKRYLKMDKRGNLRIDLEAVKGMEHLDGKYLLQTSDDTLSAEDVALGYKQLLKVEAAFRTLKQSLDLRPVYHRKEERIRAHVLLCWLALMLVRIIENQTGKTWREVRDSFGRVQLVEYESHDGKVQQRTELTPEHLGIVSALKLTEPQRIWGISLR
ncbi:IS1634 family transposase [Paenibacillus sp. MZ04-78.2]|uniref:IS1634 family transposase n=1 Tax=Paenibacillus sp. MZ04-78.2 TaxID=2962034 RepID=UPI0020B7544D|nr:IS1634 family transposase [Paenibacillus sp. MZ04-78.2]MCP3775653.1 IS1634 family transposase [Paenibacillus sp. MZ04-78.2]